MMTRYIMACVALLLFSNSLLAQNEFDLLRFSRTTPLGTARSQGMAGAFGAVGADFSSTTINPAGLGLYRRNEANLSMAVNADLSSSKYLGTTNDDSRTSFHLPSFGIVLSKVYSDMGEDRTKGLVSLNFATGLNRVGSYQQNVYYNGINNNSSILDYFVEGANGTDKSLFANREYANSPAAQAWATYLIDTAPGFNNLYTSRLSDTSNYNLKQTNQITTRGSVYEYNISAGANISNMIYFGASLVFTNINYEYLSTFEETAPTGGINGYTGSKFQTNISSAGTGVSGRFGLIIKPVDFLRIGISAQTPSRINMRDDYKFTTTGNFTTTSIVTTPLATDFIEYQIITPARYTGSAAIVFNKVGMISADIEMVDYKTAQLKSDNFDFSKPNQNAKSTLTQAYNIRLGGEYKIETPESNIADAFRVRAGYALFGSPYKTSAFNVSESKLQRQMVTGGIGMIFDRIFVDLAVSSMFGTDYTQPYVLTGKTSPTAENSFVNYNFALTGGVRF